jgi:hypothetical protein
LLQNVKTLKLGVNSRFEKKVGVLNSATDDRELR